MKVLIVSAGLLLSSVAICTPVQAAETERARPKLPEVSPLEPVRPDRAHAETLKQMEELEIRIGMLVKEGKYGEADALQRELDARKARLGIGPRPHTGPPMGRPLPGAPPEIERRLAHARMAVDSLNAAGMPELAQQVQQDVERMMRERREQAERREHAERLAHEARMAAERARAEAMHAERERAQRERPTPPERREALRRGPEPRFEVLLDEVHQLRREIQELREAVKHLSEHERK